ncbi:endocytosis defective- protein [Dimargaris verticillata]|uniref:Endocytosis defective- protein n=1 Tax=Dimargaris verticillata TaxID=2761393 RepID=A0A9W8B558_9FUNG|nr:endocytosis defective- protein [Dimargaris verticillata]
MQIGPNEYNQFLSIFQNAGPVGGALPGANARDILVQSSLPTHQLEKVWELADIDKDGNLDFDEFCVAMKLVYGLLEGQFPQVPAQLPSTLIPQSKVHLLGSAPMPPTAPGPASYSTGHTNTVVPPPPAPNEPFTWYIAPPDRSTYEARFSQYRRGAETVSLLYLNDYLKSYGLAWDDVMRYWNLIDVRRTQVLNKEQFVLLLHVLTSATKGIRIPPTLPASVRDIIQNSLRLNESLKYTSTKSHSGSNSPQGSSPGLFGKSSKNVALADSYLAKLNSNYSSKSTYGKSSSPASSSTAAGILLEEESLRDELKKLDQDIDEAEKRLDRLQSNAKDGGNNGMPSTISELEQLLDYKERLKREVVTTPHLLRDEVRQRENELHRHEGALAPLEEAITALRREKQFVDELITSTRSKMAALE